MKKQSKTCAILVLIAIILAGAVVWGLIYSLGWFIAILAFGTAYLAVMLYDKFYPVSRGVYIWTAVGIIVSNLIASILSIGISVAISAGVSIGEAFSALFNNFDVVATPFIVDSVLCVAFTILGVFGFKKFYERKKAQQKLQEELMKNITTSSAQNATAEDGEQANEQIANKQENTTAEETVVATEAETAETENVEKIKKTRARKTTKAASDKE